MSALCGECGGEMCNAQIYARSSGCTFVCSLPKDHAHEHFDRARVARWTGDTLPAPEFHEQPKEK